MPTIDPQDEPAFSRGIVGPLGKLTEDLKTKVDEATDQVFRQHCAMSATDPSTLLRDFVYLTCYGKTWRAMVAEKLMHEDKRSEAMRKLAGPFQGLELQGSGVGLRDVAEASR